MLSNFLIQEKVSHKVSLYNHNIIYGYHIRIVANSNKCLLCQKVIPFYILHTIQSKDGRLAMVKLIQEYS